MITLVIVATFMHSVEVKSGQFWFETIEECNSSLEIAKRTLKEDRYVRDYIAVCTEVKND